MIKIQTPQNINNFILIKDSDKILELHKNGFLPCYKDLDGVYFKSTPEILKILK